jgi:hypothetical protein
MITKKNTLKNKVLATGFFAGFFAEIPNLNAFRIEIQYFFDMFANKKSLFYRLLIVFLFATLFAETQTSIK